jgi:hypothetical protein
MQALTEFSDVPLGQLDLHRIRKSLGGVEGHVVLGA